MRLRCSKEKDQSIARQQVELELQLFYGHKWKMGQGKIIKRLLVLFYPKKKLRLLFRK